MKIQSKEIHNHSILSFKINADASLYRMIVKDMLENANDFIPRSVWQKVEDAANADNYKPDSSRYTEEVLSSEEMKQYADDLLVKYPDLDSLLDSWVGPRGRRESFDKKTVDDFRDYVSAIDNADFIGNLLQKQCYKIQTDISTAAEIAIINSLAKTKTSMKILEIGGGYGRLCEGLMNVYGKQIQYILADSVPISLMYCYLFLKYNLPDFKIGIYYLDPTPDLAKYDCFIVPTWYLEKIINTQNITFDLAVNIQSMQEMSQWHVDHYLQLFDKYLSSEGLVYLNNNKQYVFKGNWNYPANWKLLFRHQTPWSWSADCPTEVFEKTGQVQAENNWLVSYGHSQMVTLAERNTQNIQNQQRLLAVYHACKDNINSLKVTLKEKDMENISLQNQAVLLKRELKELKEQITEKDQIIEKNLLQLGDQKQQIEKMSVFIDGIKKSIYWKIRSLIIKNHDFPV